MKPTTRTLKKMKLHSSIRQLPADVQKSCMGGDFGGCCQYPPPAGYSSWSEWWNDWWNTYYGGGDDDD